MDLATVLQFHESWFWVAVGTTGVVGVWGLVLAVMKRKTGRAFNWGRAIAITAMLVQVGAGVYLYSNGLRHLNQFP